MHKTFVMDPHQAILSKYEANLTYDDRRKLDLLRQVLNENSNIMEEKGNISELMKIYDKILSNNRLPNLSNSMKNSIEAFETKSEIIGNLRNMKPNDASSFLIVPLMSINHVFGAVFRKTEDGYTATIVNKGARPFTNQFVEYKINGENLEKLVTDIRQIFGKGKISDIYNYFNASAYETINLHISSRPQKMGNCFIKEPENCIKFALATINFKEKDFNDMRYDNLKNFHPKWDMMTVTMHREFAAQIAFQNPNIENQVRNEIELYARNKMFREFMQKGVAVDKALSLAFDPQDAFKNLPDVDRYRKYLGQINLDTLSRSDVLKTVTDKVDTLGDLTFTAVFKDLKRAHESLKNPYSGFGRTPQDKLNNLNKLATYFPCAIKLIKYEMQNEFMRTALNQFDFVIQIPSEKLIKAFFDQIDTGISSHPNYFNHHVLRGAFNLQISQKGKDNLKDAICDLTTAVNLKDNHAMSYYLRSQSFEKSGNEQMAKIDLEKAISLDRDAVQRWKSMNPIQIFVDYYGSYEGKPLLLKGIEKDNMQVG